MNAGLVGGIVGGLLGLAGGLVGAWFSIRNTEGPRERAFMVRVSLAMWAGILLFLALLFALPHTYRWLAWIPYMVLLPLSIAHVNRRQQAIRTEESAAGASAPGKGGV